MLKPVPTPHAVVVIDDQPEFIAYVRTILDGHPQLTVLDQAVDATAALEICTEVKPDLALVDVEMPGRSGFQTARLLRTAHPNLRVIMVSGFEDPQYATLSERVGALGFIPKRELTAQAVLALL